MAKEEGQKSSSGDGEKPKRKRSKSRPTSKTRAKRQRTKDRYAHAREDAQLEGLIPTTPEEALSAERVDPATQGETPQVGLINQAIRQGWAVPEAHKPALVDELIGIAENAEMPAKVRIAAFNALRMADEAQFSRDHPELKVGKGDTYIGSVNVQNNIAAAALIREMVSRGELGLLEDANSISRRSEELQLPDQPSTSGST